MVKKVNLKEHTEKYIHFSKKAAKGEYPSKRVAMAGSKAGGVIGGIIAVIGFIVSIKGVFWGIGVLIAGLITIASNVINLSRLK